MKLSAQNDIHAPLGPVFEALTDFAYYERQLLRRGVKVVRLETPESTHVGYKWRSSVDFRGKQRELVSMVTAYEPDEGYEITTEAGGVTCFLTVDVIALSRQRTRMRTGLDLRPDTIKGRIFVQSLKFAKSNLTERLKNRVETLARDVESRAVG